MPCIWVNRVNRGYSDGGAILDTQILLSVKSHKNKFTKLLWNLYKLYYKTLFPIFNAYSESFFWKNAERSSFSNNTLFE